jgi:hypothetical protein
MSKRAVIIAILFSSLTLAAQFEPRKSKKAPLDRNEQAVTEQLQRAEEDPRLAAERDRMDAQLNRELLEMRHSVIQDSMNRMNQARFNYGRGNNERIIDQFMAFSIFVIILCAILWLIRTIVENRRWNRVAAIQTEVHTKLLEKMSSSQELLSYMDTEAGKRFLESSPFEIESRSRPTFPLGRILLSAQVGVVILIAGAAVIWLQDRMPDDAQPLLLFGTLGMAVGIGLLISSGLAYTMSKHLGLTSEITSK